MKPLPARVSGMTRCDHTDLRPAVLPGGARCATVSSDRYIIRDQILVVRFFSVLIVFLG